MKTRRHEDAKKTCIKTAERLGGNRDADLGRKSGYLLRGFVSSRLRDHFARQPCETPIFQSHPCYREVRTALNPDGCTQKMLTPNDHFDGQRFNNLGLPAGQPFSAVLSLLRER